MSEQNCNGDTCSLGQPSPGGQFFSDVRKEFPIFANRPEFVFFDNASTSQKPASVIQAITDFYELVPFIVENLVDPLQD